MGVALARSMGEPCRTPERDWKVMYNDNPEGGIKHCHMSYHRTSNPEYAVTFLGMYFTCKGSTMPRSGLICLHPMPAETDGQTDEWTNKHWRRMVCCKFVRSSTYFADSLVVKHRHSRSLTSST